MNDIIIKDFDKGKWDWLKNSEVFKELFKIYKEEGLLKSAEYNERDECDKRSECGELDDEDCLPAEALECMVEDNLGAEENVEVPSNLEEKMAQLVAFLNKKAEIFIKEGRNKKAIRFERMAYDLNCDLRKIQKGVINSCLKSNII